MFISILLFGAVNLYVEYFFLYYFIIFNTRIVLHKLVRAIKNTPSAHCCSHPISTAADIFPPQRPNWTAVSITAPLWS